MLKVVSSEIQPSSQYAWRRERSSNMEELSNAEKEIQENRKKILVRKAELGD